MRGPPPRSTLFPYTTLFRSGGRPCRRTRRADEPDASDRPPAGPVPQSRGAPAYRRPGVDPPARRLGGATAPTAQHPRRLRALGERPAVAQRDPPAGAAVLRLLGLSRQVLPGAV